MEHSMVQANRRILSFAAAAVFAVLLTSSVISIRQPVGDDSTFQSLNNSLSTRDALCAIPSTAPAAILARL
jgi:hypothetical protein